MNYTRLEVNDINKFVENRIEFITLIRTIENINLFREKTLHYINTNLNSDNLIIYAAIDNEEIISSCMLCIFQTAPTPSSLNGKIRHLSMYILFPNIEDKVILKTIKLITSRSSI